VVNKSDNNILLTTQAIRNNELTGMIVPDTKFNCVGLYKDSLALENLESNKDLCDCSILEIITDFSIDIRNIINLIKKASFRLVDGDYAPDGFHFLVRNVRGKEV